MKVKKLDQVKLKDGREGIILQIRPLTIGINHEFTPILINKIDIECIISTIIERNKLREERFIQGWNDIVNG